MDITSNKAYKISTILALLLILLFFYTATSKLLDLSEFKRQLANQSLPTWSVEPLLWAIPSAEILLTGLLMVESTRKIGFYGSAIIMLIFTSYMGLVLLNVFDRVPCSCGGVLKSLDFTTHFVFNFFFLALSILGIYVINQQKKGGSVATSTP